MRPHWIIQNNMFSEAGFQRLVDALDRLGSSYSLHKVVPFIHAIEPEVTLSCPVVVMGSYTLAKIAAERGWSPGAWASAKFNMARLMSSPWSQRLFNSSKTSQVDRLRDVVDYFGDKRSFFIRPCDDSKAFVGQVMDWPSFAEWREKVLALTPEDGATVTGETMVVIAEPKVITREWRTWIVDGRVVTASQYKLGSRPCYDARVDQRVIDFASEMSTIWCGGCLVRGCDLCPDLAPAYCLDVFETESGELKIGEVNCLNAAGFYEADMAKLVDAIESMAG